VLIRPRRFDLARREWSHGYRRNPEAETLQVRMRTLGRRAWCRPDNRRRQVIEKAAVFVEIEHEHPIPLWTVLERIVHLCQEALSHQQVVPRVIVVGRAHILCAVGVIGIDENHIGELALARVPPELLDGIGDAVISPAGEEASLQFPTLGLISPGRRRGSSRVPNFQGPIKQRLGHLSPSLNRLPERASALIA